MCIEICGVLGSSNCGERVVSAVSKEPENTSSGQSKWVGNTASSASDDGVSSPLGPVPRAKRSPRWLPVGRSFIVASATIAAVLGLTEVAPTQALEPGHDTAGGTSYDEPDPEPKQNDFGGGHPSYTPPTPTPAPEPNDLGGGHPSYTASAPAPAPLEDPYEEPESDPESVSVVPADRYGNEFGSWAEANASNQRGDDEANAARGLASGVTLEPAPLEDPYEEPESDPDSVSVVPVDRYGNEFGSWAEANASNQRGDDEAFAARDAQAGRFRDNWGNVFDSQLQADASNQRGEETRLAALAAQKEDPFNSQFEPMTAVVADASGWGTGDPFAVIVDSEMVLADADQVVVENPPAEDVEPTIEGLLDTARELEAETADKEPGDEESGDEEQAEEEVVENVVELWEELDAAEARYLNQTPLSEDYTEPPSLRDRMIIAEFSDLMGAPADDLPTLEELVTDAEEAVRNGGADLEHENLIAEYDLERSQEVAESSNSNESSQNQTVDSRVQELASRFSSVPKGLEYATPELLEKYMKHLMFESSYNRNGVFEITSDGRVHSTWTDDKGTPIISSEFEVDLLGIATVTATGETEDMLREGEIEIQKWGKDGKILESSNEHEITGKDTTIHGEDGSVLNTKVDAEGNFIESSRDLTVNDLGLIEYLNEFEHVIGGKLVTRESGVWTEALVDPNGVVQSSEAWFEEVDDEKGRVQYHERREYGNLLEVNKSYRTEEDGRVDVTYDGEGVEIFRETEKSIIGGTISTETVNGITSTEKRTKELDGVYFEIDDGHGNKSWRREKKQYEPRGTLIEILDEDQNVIDTKFEPRD